MKNYKFKISNKIISQYSKPFLIAEVGQSHEGNLKKVFKIIDKISKTGVDAIKFQTHIAESESTLDEPFRKKNKFFKSRFDYWKSMEFSKNEWKKIKDYCKKRRVIFLSSVFSVDSVKLLSSIGLRTWKIGSGEFRSMDIFDYIKKYRPKDPILLSTGLMNLSQIKFLYNYLKKTNPLCIMYCVSEYPCKIKSLGLNNIEIFKKNFRSIIGYSDHSGSIYPIIYAILKGASIVEFHVKINESRSNIDRSSSININELSQIVKANEIFHQIRNFKVDKKNLSNSQIKMIKIFSKSLALNKNKKKNSIIQKKDLTLKKPGTGMSPNLARRIIGKKLRKNKSKMYLLKQKDLINF